MNTQPNHFTPTPTRANNIIGDHVLEAWELTAENGTEETLNLHFDIEYDGESHWGHLTHAPFGALALNRDALVQAFGRQAVRDAEDTAATQFGEGDAYDKCGVA